MRNLHELLKRAEIRVTSGEMAEALDVLAELKRQVSLLGAMMGERVFTRRKATTPFVPLSSDPQIRIRVARVDWGVVVEYFGHSIQHLYVTGCVTDRMMKQWARGTKGGRAFKDEHGDKFRRWPRPSKAYPDGVLVTRNIHDARHYNVLPGVLECLHTAPAETRSTEENSIAQVTP